MVLFNRGKMPCYSSSSADLFKQRVLFGVGLSLVLTVKSQMGERLSRPLALLEYC